jgi:hypothetical protein
MPGQRKQRWSWLINNCLDTKAREIGEQKQRGARQMDHAPLRLAQKHWLTNYLPFLAAFFAFAFFLGILFSPLMDRIIVETAPTSDQLITLRN